MKLSIFLLLLFYITSFVILMWTFNLYIPWLDSSVCMPEFDHSLFSLSEIKPSLFAVQNWMILSF